MKTEVIQKEIKKYAAEYSRIEIHNYLYGGGTVTKVIKTDLKELEGIRKAAIKKDGVHQLKESETVFSYIIRSGAILGGLDKEVFFYPSTEGNFKAYNHNIKLYNYLDRYNYFTDDDDLKKFHQIVSSAIVLYYATKTEFWKNPEEYKKNGWDGTEQDFKSRKNAAVNKENKARNLSTEWDKHLFLHAKGEIKKVIERNLTKPVKDFEYFSDSEKVATEEMYFIWIKIT